MTLNLGLPDLSFYVDLGHALLAGICITELICVLLSVTYGEAYNVCLVYYH